MFMFNLMYLEIYDNTNRERRFETQKNNNSLCAFENPLALNNNKTNTTGIIKNSPFYLEITFIKTMTIKAKTNHFGM